MPQKKNEGDVAFFATFSLSERWRDIRGEVTHEQFFEIGCKKDR